ncbi:MAG: putative lipid II flippase FtsW [Actinomycetota bacterium]|nr:putative lipid II flippase FtsW [Actinomycetota bacterium]
MTSRIRSGTQGRTSTPRGAGSRAARRQPVRSRRGTPSIAAATDGQRLATILSLLFLVLTMFGLVMVLSASSATSVHKLESTPFHQFKRQAMWAALGAVAFVVASRFDHRHFRRLATPLLGLTFAMLVAVLIPGLGRNLNGSNRWLGVGPAVFQPSEVAKFVMVVFIADLLSRRSARMDRPDLTVRPVAVVVGSLAGLLILQPKLGTSVILASVALLMLFVAGARASSLMGWASFGLLLVAVAAYLEPYRRARLFAFVDPWADPLGSGLQTIQSQVGIASGGLLGVGIGNSRSKWGFLPEAHSDFIFAIVAEEVGLLGAGALIVSFLLLGYLGVRTALHAADRFGTLLAAGITGWLIIQAFLNIGMAMGLMPITGEPLPFVSAGGSSLIMTLGAAGVLVSIARTGSIKNASVLDTSRAADNRS